MLQQAYRIQLVLRPLIGYFVILLIFSQQRPFQSTDWLVVSRLKFIPTLQMIDEMSVELGRTSMFLNRALVRFVEDAVLHVLVKSLGLAVIVLVDP